MNHPEPRSDCCASAQVGMARSVPAKCSHCGRPGKPISTLTLKHLVNPGFLSSVQKPGFLFCASPDCGVVYFHPDGQELRENDLRVPVELKSPDNAPICYCFGFTQKMVEDELRASGECTIPGRIAAEMKAGNCACEVRNPQGSCCLGRVSMVVKTLKSALPHSASLTGLWHSRIRSKVPLRTLSLISIIGAGIFAAAEIVQPFYRSDRALSDAYSSYASGKYGFVQTLAFVALSVASFGLFFGLSLLRGSGAGWRLGKALLTVWSTGVLVAAIFPMEGGALPASANIHSLASMVSFPAIIASMSVFSRAFERNIEWRRFSFCSWLFALLGAVSFVFAAAIHHPTCFAILQRLFLGSVVIWITATGAYMRKLGGDKEAPLFREP